MAILWIAWAALNDMTADSKGGVYFTMGGVFHADSKGTVTKYGENMNPNGIVLSPDEKHLYVTNGATLAAFDVRRTARSRISANSRSSKAGRRRRQHVRFRRAPLRDPQVRRQVLAGRQDLGVIPTPRAVITVTFSGPDRKTLYAVSRTGNTDWIIAIPMIAQGPKGRGK